MTPATYLRQKYVRQNAALPKGLSEEVRKKIEHELHLINDSLREPIS